jgi:hypothetical protein
VVCINIMPIFLPLYAAIFVITYDARKNFVSNKFKQYALVIRVGTKGVLVKAHNSISIVKRYHGLL